MEIIQGRFMPVNIAFSTIMILYQIKMEIRDRVVYKGNHQTQIQQQQPLNIKHYPLISIKD